MLFNIILRCYLFKQKSGIKIDVNKNIHFPVASEFYGFIYVCSFLFSSSSSSFLPTGSKQPYWVSLAVLGEIRAVYVFGVVCSLARESHFLVRGHWVLSTVHQHERL